MIPGLYEVIQCSLSLSLVCCALPLFDFWRAYLVWLGRLVSGLYEVIHYTHTPPELLSLLVCKCIFLRWKLRCTASGPQPYGVQGSTGLRPMPPHCSWDVEHGPGAGPGLLPRLPPPTCSRPVSGVGLGLFCMRFFYRGVLGPAIPLFAH
jgi:hypothetical protein